VLFSSSLMYLYNNNNIFNIISQMRFGMVRMQPYLLVKVRKVIVFDKLSVQVQYDKIKFERKKYDNNEVMLNIIEKRIVATTHNFIS